MISYLSGKILNKGNGYIIVLVGQIGYKVFVNAVWWAELHIGDDIALYIYEQVSEQFSGLFGMRNMPELELYEMLLSVSGVGPKTALGVLGAARAGEIRESIGRGDPALLNKVSGIGKKTAERIVLELRTKVGHLAGVDAQGRAVPDANTDEIDALIALGYSLQQARDALQSVDPSLKNSGERVRAALKGMGK